MKDISNVEHATKAQVVLLSGFMGAGKTTLLKRILSWPVKFSDTVVIVNEFGDAGIDGLLLKDSKSDIIELSSGCICCTLKGDFKQSLSNVWDTYHPARILIETSGVADPASVISVFNMPIINACMELIKIITVLDADFWEAREVFGPLFYSQLKTAHLILLNKIDLLNKSKIPLFLREIHKAIPDCQVIPTIRCRIDPETLWMASKPKSINLQPIRKFLPTATGHDQQLQDRTGDNLNLAETAATVNFVTFSYINNDALDEASFKKFVDDLPWEVFRMKGLIQFADRTELINFVGGKSEWSPWDGEPETRLVFIGWDIDPKQILQHLPP